MAGSETDRICMCVCVGVCADVAWRVCLSFGLCTDMGCLVLRVPVSCAAEWMDGPPDKGRLCVCGVGRGLVCRCQPDNPAESVARSPVASSWLLSLPSLPLACLPRCVASLELTFAAPPNTHTQKGTQKDGESDTWHPHNHTPAPAHISNLFLSHSGYSLHAIRLPARSHCWPDGWMDG